MEGAASPFMLCFSLIKLHICQEVSVKLYSLSNPSRCREQRQLGSQSAVALSRAAPIEHSISCCDVQSYSSQGSESKSVKSVASKFSVDYSQSSLQRHLYQTSPEVLVRFRVPVTL